MGLDTASGSTLEMRKPNLTQRALEEVKKISVMFLYLFLLFGLFRIHESIILTEHQIPLSNYGFALVNALILAKVMLVAEDLRLGSRFKGSRVSRVATRPSGRRDERQNQTGNPST